jgi:outer membrane protein OmpA-like peptidoglycan-associated protein
MFSIGANRTNVSTDFVFHPDTAAKTVSPRTGLRIGFTANIPFQDQRFLFQPAIIYSSNGSKVQQDFEPKKSSLVYFTTEQKVNYINVPLNVIYQLPLKEKTVFHIGAGPQLSLFYNGKINTTSLDTFGKVREINEEDPLVGKGNDKYRSLYLSANAVAGFDFGRIGLMLNYSKGVTSFYQTAENKYQFDGIGLTVNIGLNNNPNSKPVIKDKDKDGVPDKEDECPNEAGSSLTKGCKDSDGDGIADKADKCPSVAGLAKYKGCPIPDTDKDGVNDEEDKCPTIQGTKENNGCPHTETRQVEPEVKPVISEKAAEQISFNAKQIQFKFRQAELTEDSYKVLDEIAKILLNSDQKISVEGHSSLEGNPRSNLSLSQQRADAVKKYLISKGISADRISSTGFGSTQPLIKGTSEKANVQNRRVEIKLIQ